MQSANIKSPQSVGCMLILLTFMVIGAFLYIGRGRTDSASKRKQSPETMSSVVTNDQPVNLAWTPSTGPGVVLGQYLYISNSPDFDDSPTRTPLDSTTESFTVSPLSPGTYYVAVTAFNNSNDAEFESMRSNVLTVIVSEPSPTPGITPTPSETPTPTAAPFVGNLVNISTRAFVMDRDNVLIAGFIIRHGERKVLIRAIGPSLSPFFPIVLNNPLLELRTSTGGLLDENDDWRDDQEQEIIASGLAPSNDKESAILRTVPPGNYTAIVRGVNNGTGVALVEVYAIENP